MKPLRIFIGYDPVEAVAYHVMAHSILSRASVPVSITPINLYNLRSIHNRARDPKQSNEFSVTRFLVPYLADYEGHAAFFDCDMMVTCDIAELFGYADPDKAVHVVQHDYTPRTEVKYLGNVQHAYPRKNWSSVVLWNCGHAANRVITPDAANEMDPAHLHRFTWLEDEEIGVLPIEWNWLVGEYAMGEHGITHPKSVKNWHWTIGGPWFDEFMHVDGSDLWFRERAHMTHCLQRTPI